jgi:phenylacetic acid degradation operon negative regulatory protein
MPAATANPSARSLLLDLLSTLRRGSMPVRALVEAGSLFGIAEGSIRVALTRGLGEGLLERDERGAYRLGERATAVAERVASWRRLETRLRPWSGGWLTAIAANVPSTRPEQRRHARALRLLGFRELTRNVAVRPDNLAGGVDAARAELTRFELAPGSIVCALHGLDAVSEARARTLWDGDRLVDGYRSARQTLDASAERIDRLPESEAMVESFRLGGAALRRLTLDPLLPEPIVPAAERAALVAAMRRYDAAGRRCWSSFLARHGVRHRSAPADTRAHALGGFS